MARMTIMDAQVAMKAFADAAPVGTPCRYYPVAGDPEFQETRIRSEPWMLGHGAIVVKVEGRAGGVSIEHIELTAPEPA